MGKLCLYILLFPLLAFAETENDQIIHRPFYSLSYNEQHEVANWVDYSLEIFQLHKCVERTNSFRIDPLILTGSSSPTDYYKSGFDRGHLLPAGDMKFDKEAIRDTFYMSNMTPQPSKFNSGKWRSLETLVRAWAMKYKKIWIVTGPVLQDNLPSIGVENRVSIPEEYFKVLLRKENDKYFGIGFLMRTTVPYPHLISYAVSIRQVETLTGIDFFSYLNDEAEEEAEAELNINAWDFKAKFSYLPCLMP